MEPSSDTQFLAQMLSKTIYATAIHQQLPAADLERLETIAIHGHSSVPINPSTGEAPS